MQRGRSAGVLDMAELAGLRVVVLGRQGAGKGTQCVRLARRLRVPHISTGDVLRAAVHDGTDLGRRVAVVMNAGDLVPDALMLDVVADRLRQPDAKRGFVLDGFPRTLAQGQALLDLLGDHGLDLAVDLDVPEDVVIARIAARRICRDCGDTSVALDAATTAYPCECGGTMEQRADDTELAVSRRLAIYADQTRPLVNWLASLNLLVTVDGTGSPDDVEARLLSHCRHQRADSARTRRQFA